MLYCYVISSIVVDARMHISYVFLVLQTDNTAS